MEPFVLTINPGEVIPGRTFAHPGEEFILVLKGEMDYRVGEQVFAMQEGDSLYFDGSTPHAPVPRQRPATFLAVFSAAQRRLPGSHPRKAASR